MGTLSEYVSLRRRLCDWRTQAPWKQAGVTTLVPHFGSENNIAEFIWVFIVRDIYAGLATDAGAVACLWALQGCGTLNATAIDADNQCLGVPDIALKHVAADFARLPNEFVESRPLIVANP